MKKIIPVLIIGIFILSGLGAVGTPVHVKTIEDEYNVEYDNSFNDLSAYTYHIAREGRIDQSNDDPITKLLVDYPIGETIWQYTITTGWDNSPKAIAPITDINDDDIDDVIVCSEDDYVRCFDGAAIGTGVILWEHEIYAGDIYSQKGLDIIADVDEDGYDDVVVGATGGARLIRCISGKEGTSIWTHDTHEYGDGGWVYQVDCSYDYNDDDFIDVLATTGDDSSDNGPKRVYCLNGKDGVSIWERPLGGPGFSVIGVEDFSGDGEPDVLAGASNEYETDGFAYGINGATSLIDWSFETAGSSVWALEQIDDITSDGIPDVVIGDFSGKIYGLDATTGNQEYLTSLGSVIITRFARLNDVNGDGHPDIIPAHSTTHITQVIDGQTGDTIWAQSVADQPWNVAQIDDISGDGINDVLVGTLFQSNYCYFLSGVDGSELESLAYGEAVDAIAAIPDVVNDGSMEMVAGGRDGKVRCISGGLDVGVNNPPEAPTIDGETEGQAGTEYDYTFTSADPEGQDVYYYIEWGDDTYEEWIGPYASEEAVIVSHTWDEEDDYIIGAKAKDTFDAESDWATLEITMPVNMPMMVEFLHKFWDRFPHAFPILRNILGLSYPSF